VLALTKKSCAPRVQQPSFNFVATPSCTISVATNRTRKRGHFTPWSFRAVANIHERDGVIGAERNAASTMIASLLCQVIESASWPYVHGDDIHGWFIIPGPTAEFRWQTSQPAATKARYTGFFLPPGPVTNSLRLSQGRCVRMPTPFYRFPYS
jgi:hypothetical protein